MGVKVFACCSALKVALVSLISFESERAPEIEEMQGYSLVFFPNFGSSIKGLIIPPSVSRALT